MPCSLADWSATNSEDDNFHIYKVCKLRSLTEFGIIYLWDRNSIFKYILRDNRVQKIDICGSRRKLSGN
jgi:hypothetical protein